MKQQKSLLAGALLGALGVALGAFGAHALKPMLTASGRLEAYELAVRYEFYHALALLLTGVLQQFITSNYIKIASLFFLLGTVVFSGSLYLLSISNNTLFAMATPIGGAVLILGWVFLIISIINRKNKAIPH